MEVTPSAAKTCALRISGVRLHIPPVAPTGNRSRRLTSQASLSPVFRTSMLKLPHCPRLIGAVGPDFVTTSAGPGELLTMSIVGSSGIGVSGSSDGRLTMPLSALTKPWFEITVPLAALGFTTTLNVMEATLAWLLDASGGIKPAVVLAGELIRMLFTSGETP